MEITPSRRRLSDIFETGENGKERISQERILYPAKLSFRNEGKIKTFPNKQRLRQFILNKSAVKEMLSLCAGLLGSVSLESTPHFPVRGKQLSAPKNFQREPVQLYKLVHTVEGNCLLSHSPLTY